MTVHVMPMCLCGHEQAMHAADKGPCQRCQGPQACQRFRGRRATVREDAAGHAPTTRVPSDVLERIARALERLAAAADRGAGGEVRLAELPEVLKTPRPQRAPQPRTPKSPRPREPGAIRILKACAQHPTGCTRPQIGILTGYAPSTRNTYIRRLENSGFVTDGLAGRVQATPAGMQHLGADFEPLPVGDALRAKVLEGLGDNGAGAVLQSVVARYPQPVSRDTLRDETDFRPSTLNTYVRRLQVMELVEALPHGFVLARQELFS
jgi:hypothetical protein